MVFFAAPESLPRKTLVKKGIVRGEKRKGENRVGYSFLCCWGGRYYQPERGTAGDPKCQRSGEDGFDSEPCEDRRKSILFENGRKYQSINYIDEAFNTGQIKSKKEITPVSTRITRRREESLQQWPNEEGEKDQRKEDSVKPVRTESRTEKKIRRREGEGGKRLDIERERLKERGGEDG